MSKIGPQKRNPIAILGLDGWSQTYSAYIRWRRNWRTMFP